MHGEVFGSSISMKFPKQSSSTAGVSEHKCRGFESGNSCEYKMVWVAILCYNECAVLLSDVTLYTGCN